MPNDLLLPAFLLTLVANALLVAIAIRALTRNRAERDRETRWTGLPDTRTVVRPAPLPTEPPVVGLPEREPAVTPESRPEPPPVAEPASAIVSDPAPGPSSASPRRKKPTARPSVASPRKRGSTSATPKSATSRTNRASDQRTDTTRAGRRRFSLPPLDEDHERVSRSIQSFLSGADLPEVPDAGPNPAAAPVPTTIAVVAVHGLDDASASNDAARRDGVEAALATVERTLRSAARTADRVTTTGSGRYRVVLPGTGELAARSYLRRVRASVDPSLTAVDGPLVLVTATTTVLDEPVASASARAEGRLDATLAGLTRDAADREPRVAGD
jgi:GGDEF domain-containing protein